MTLLAFYALQVTPASNPNKLKQQITQKTYSLLKLRPLILLHVKTLVPSFQILKLGPPRIKYYAGFSPMPLHIPMILI